MSSRFSCLLLALVAASAHAATVGETDHFIPLIQDGGGWSTQVTVVNLSSKPALVVTTFLTAKGYSAEWKVDLKASTGTIARAAVDSQLSPGGVAVIETSGVPAELTRGYAEIYSLSNGPFSASAQLVRRENGQVTQSITVPLAPAFESRAVISLDFTNPQTTLEMALVSPTNSTTLDLVFRKENGEPAFRDQITLDGSAQIFVDLLQQWPQLTGFRGSMEWTASFPAADRYEYRYLTGIALWGTQGRVLFAVPAMTLPGDQRSPSPYI